MRIGLEASALLGCKSGVGYYTENLLEGVMKIAPQHDYVLFSNRSIANIKHLPSARVHEGHHFPMRAAWMQAVLPGALRHVQPDICHFTNYLAPVSLSCPYVVTVYDMTLYIMPRYHRFKKLVLDRTLIPIVARRADAILTISKSAKADIVRYLRVPARKVKVVSGAVSPDFAPVADPTRIDEVRTRYGLCGPFILYVGTLEPRKNLVRLVQALAELKKRGLPHKLAMVGQPGWQCAPIFAEVERLGLKHDVVFTGYVPFEDLPALYSAAEAMAFPSLYEGFGLPVVEAMACGTPVVTSNSSSLSEVADGAALLVDPLSVSEIADAIYRLHRDDELRQELGRLGQERARQYSWEESARSTLRVYEEVAAGPQSPR